MKYEARLVLGGSPVNLSPINEAPILDARGQRRYSTELGLLVRALHIRVVAVQAFDALSPELQVQRPAEVRVAVGADGAVENEVVVELAESLRVTCSRLKSATGLSLRQ